MHRDIRPENIMFEKDEVKLCSDGSTMRFLSDESNIPLLESPHYSAPGVL